MGFKPKTCVRYNTPWHAHALTFSCYKKLSFFASGNAAEIFLGFLDVARKSHKFDIWAYVVMPDHVHLLIRPREESYSISDILFAIKRPASYKIKKEGLVEASHFWQQGGGYDRNIWKVATLYKEIDYMHANPVRRGLCSESADWKYSSSAYWEGHRDVPLVLDETLPSRE